MAQEYIFSYNPIYGDIGICEPETFTIQTGNDRQAKNKAVGILVRRIRSDAIAWAHGAEAENLPTYRFNRIARVVRDSSGRWESSRLVDISDVQEIINIAMKRKAA